ncbi:MAG: lysophospholipid acyltransferase family protein [Bacteroidia bacterium]|nr:lysophospholipid acyltransferase family protein [Bacteroidia bacterium]
MSAIGYYIFYGFNWIITLLPLRVLYLFSDLIFLFFYYFPGYRRKVVRTNLNNSFPDKSEKEIITIEKKFYRHLCDLFIETFKLTHLSSRQLMKRVPLTNPELLEKLYSEGRDVAAILGHFGNWEWLICLPLYANYKFVSIYKPLANNHFDKFMIDNRTRFGMTVTPMQHVVRDVLNNRKNKIRALYSFLTDQTPAKGDIRFWSNFLNQETPVYRGAEKIASKYDMAVIFFNIQKVKRGQYYFTIELLFEHSAGLPEYVITETHVKRLEEIIKEHPEYWIWSHKRWKHKREPQNG